MKKNGTGWNPRALVWAIALDRPHEILVTIAAGDAALGRPHEILVTIAAGAAALGVPLMLFPVFKRGLNLRRQPGVAKQ